MANARALDKRRKSVRNIRKITRTMELIATARYRKAMDRAMSATDFTNRIMHIVSRLAASGSEVEHPLLEPRTNPKNVAVLVLTSNRGLCGGYNGSVFRLAHPHIVELKKSMDNVYIDVCGKRGIGALKFKGVEINKAYLEFDDQPKYDDVEAMADDFLLDYCSGKIDRLDVVYTKFFSTSKQVAVVETLLPLDVLEDGAAGEQGSHVEYDFLPSAESIVQEIVPASFKARLFNCFLDAAVSEQVARMIAMKSATENAGDIIKKLSMTYNRARQSQITGEIMEIIGGVEALAN